MVFKVKTVAFSGLSALKVEVQVSILSGLPSFSIVGLPDKSVAESKERVRSSLNAMGLSLPAKRITVNLAPADLTKIGSHFDLPVALGVLGAMEAIEGGLLDGYFILGELSLDGTIDKVSGVLPTAMEATSNNLGIICPEKNGIEASWSGNENIIAPDSLTSLINHFKGKQVLEQPMPEKLQALKDSKDLSDIKGQKYAKRALEIAAAGGHNMLMCGPPGAGKSMLAERINTILPELTSEEVLEVSMINSVSGNLQDGSLITNRPFRSPHNSTSMIAMVGGGRKAYPGEISLSHRGVLFLDEFPEFSRDTIEGLRQSMESGAVTIARANSHVTYPANFQLIAAMNPCRCGYAADPERACTKLPKCAIDYKNKISGPIYDRFDLFIDVPEVSITEVMSSNIETIEKSKTVLDRVVKARNIQLKRYEQYPNIKTNSDSSGNSFADATVLNLELQKFIAIAAEKFKISMRGLNRTLKVARTIADLDNEPLILKRHLTEALNYRLKNYN